MATLTHKGKFTQLDGSKAYAKLREEVYTRGIMDRSYIYYFFLSLFILGGFAASIYFIYISHSIPIVIISGIVFAFFAVQIGGFLHDAGHRAIFTSNRLNDIIGNISGLLLAESFNYWKTKHNLHHAHTNQEEEDPDLDIPFLSFTKEQYASRKGLMKWLSKYQSYLFFPLGTLAVFSPRIESIKYLKTNFRRDTWWEIILFSAGFFCYFILPFLVFPFSKAIVLFFVVSVGMGFYLLNVFAPNHKGMPQIAKGVKLSFIEQQIMTSRNIRGHWLTDFLYLGLNYQIEHHLFPACPRNKLRRISPLVHKFCMERNLDYTVVGYIETNKIILSELHQIAREN
jgi:fatty acid desaturase